jgi:hypothetical protein
MALFKGEEMIGFNGSTATVADAVAGVAKLGTETTAV